MKEVTIGINDCRVYWATHGCKKKRGHKGNHKCDCGQKRPLDHKYTFGEDWKPNQTPS